MTVFSLQELGLMRDMIETCDQLDGLDSDEQNLYDKILKAIEDDG